MMIKGDKVICMKNINVSYNSKLYLQQSGSMTTIVPKSIVDLFGLKSGDTFNWIVNIDEKGISLTIKMG